MESKSILVAFIITIGFMIYAFIYHLNVKKFEFLFQTKLTSLTRNLSPKYETGRPAREPLRTRYVYVDMGTNDGRSVLSFFGMNEKTYPALMNQSLIDENDWIVYVFEANPKFNQEIKAVTEKVRAKYPRVTFKLFTETAIWTYNGQVKFYLDTVNVGANYWGSSLKDNHNDVIKSKKYSVNVSCVNIVDVFKEFNQEDLVVAKMDVEGAEYELLTHMIVNNVFKVVDYLAVEYHNGVMQKNPRSIITSESMLNFIIDKFSVKLIKWV